MSAPLQAVGLSRTFPSPGGPVHAVVDASLSVAAGELDVPEITPWIEAHLVDA